MTRTLAVNGTSPTNTVVPVLILASLELPTVRPEISVIKFLGPGLDAAATVNLHCYSCYHTGFI